MDKTIKDSPLCQRFFFHWLSQGRNNPAQGWDQYQNALDLYFMAHLETGPPGNRYAFLQQSLNILSALTENRADFSRLQTMARLTWELGKRGITLQILNLLSDMFQHEKDFFLNEPFLPVTDRYDFKNPHGKNLSWFLSSVLEHRERVRAFSSYFSGEKSLRILDILNHLGFQEAEMERRRQLIRIRYNIQDSIVLNPILSSKTPDNLNPHFWTLRNHQDTK